MAVPSDISGLVFWLKRTTQPPSQNQALLKTSATDYAVAWTSLTKSMVGLSAVNNTSDANKPVSTAQAAAISAAVAAQPEFFSIAIGDETTAIGSILKG